MAKKKTPAPPKNDFSAEEELDVCGFSSNPIITGECITSFSFDDVSADENPESVLNLLNNNIVTSESTSTKTIDFNNTTNNKDILTDNRKASIVNGCAPPIDGEYLNVKRTYMLRSSTVRKLNELKSINYDLNTYVSTIVDLAIAHYYNHIINEGGKQ